MNPFGSASHPPCPSCGAYMVSHCSSSTCPWSRCPRHGCGLYGGRGRWAKPGAKYLDPNEAPEGPEPKDQM